MSDIRTDLFMQVVEREGKVLLLFSRQQDGELVSESTDHFMLPPQDAINVAEVLTQMAFEVDTGLKPVGPALKASLVQKHRDILIPRIATMLGSLRENRLLSNGDVALKLMDAVCNEVFG